MNLDELMKIKNETLENLELTNTDKDMRVVIGMATCGISAGAKQVYNTILEEVKKRNLKYIHVVPTGCIGMCTYEPIVEVYSPNNEKISYIHVNPDKAKRIVAEHLVNRRVIKEYTIGSED
jgi:NADP-reducing hydrogenase subunit HndB